MSGDILLIGPKISRGTFVTSGRFDTKKYQAFLDQMIESTNNFESLKRYLDEARVAISGLQSVLMDTRTYRMLQKDEKKRKRFPHLYREHFPKRHERSMRGK